MAEYIFLELHVCVFKRTLNFTFNSKDYLKKNCLLKDFLMGKMTYDKMSKWFVHTLY